MQVLGLTKNENIPRNPFMKRHLIVSLLLLAFSPLALAQNASTALIAANFSEEKGWSVAGTNAAS